MLGHSPGSAYAQGFVPTPPPPPAYNEQTWSLAKFTSLSGPQKVNIEGGVRAVFSQHRRQLAVWHESAMMMCLDLHHAKTSIPMKDVYAIVKENNASLCRLKFRSLPDRVSFGAALGELVHVSNDKGASSQEPSSQSWQGSSQGASTSSQSEYSSASSQGRPLPTGTHDDTLDCMPRPSRVSTPLSTIQLTPCSDSPWRCFFPPGSTVSPLSPIKSVFPPGGDTFSTLSPIKKNFPFKTPILNRSNKSIVLFEEEEEAEAVEEAPAASAPASPTKPPSEGMMLDRSTDLFEDDENSRSRSELGDTVPPFALDAWKGPAAKEESRDLFEDETDAAVEDKACCGGQEESVKTEEDEEEEMEGEWGMTTSFIDRLREIPQPAAKLREGDVVRVKGDRAAMHGQDCPCCREYYDALGLDDEERRKRVDYVSRHRFVARPMPETPPHYWDIDFPSEEEQRARGLLMERK